MKVNDKLIVGEDTEAKELYTIATDKRIKAFKQLLGFIEALELKVNKEALYQAPADEFKRAFLEENSSDVLKKLSYEKKLELFEVNVTTLNNLISDFQANNNPFNIDTFDYQMPSFDIVLEDAEQIKRYQSTTKLIEALGDFTQHQSIFYGDLIQSLRGAVIMDRSLQRLRPNLYWIRNEYR